MEKAGYGAELAQEQEGAQVDLILTGMSCAACAAGSRRRVGKRDGVDTAQVNLSAGTARVQYDPLKIKSYEIIDEIRKAGYGAEKLEDDRPDRASEIRRAEIRSLGILVAVSAALSAPLVLSMVLMLAGVHTGLIHDRWLHLALATPVQFVIGWRFYRNAWHGVRGGSPGMDLLVALGTSAA